MAWQERLHSLGGLKKDYFRGGKLSESSRFCLFTLSVGKKRGCGRRSVLNDFIIFYFNFVNKVFFIPFKVLSLLCTPTLYPYLTAGNE